MEKEPRNKVVVFCTEGTNSRLLVNLLLVHFDLTAVYVEPNENKRKVFKRRVKNLGLLKALGQVAFQLGILPFIRSKGRKKELLANFNQRDLPIANNLKKNVASINNLDIEKVFATDKPDFIFINGTGILDKNLLEKIDIPIVNIHVGITPAFRGVHGGYWAIRNQQPELFGVTLHLVDAGIDTGNIIDQKILTIEETDNFKTYPLLQYIGGLKLIEKNITQFKNKEIKTKESITSVSELHSHPTYFGYLKGRLKLKAK